MRSLGGRSPRSGWALIVRGGAVAEIDRRLHAPLNPSGPFRLYRFPAATQRIRHGLASPRFPAFAADAFN
jgi:hypothetical protein